MGVRNKELRVYKGGVSLQEIAQAAHIHRNTISRWFNDSEMCEVRAGIVTKAIDEIKEARGTISK